MRNPGMMINPADRTTYYKPKTMEKPIFEVSARLMTYLQSMR